MYREPFGPEMLRSASTRISTGSVGPIVAIAPDEEQWSSVVAPHADLRLELDPHPLVDRVKEVFSALERDLIGFGPLLVQTIYALLTRENLLIFSPPGTAKTLFASAVFSRIAGARVFDTQMSKGTLAEELFGSIDTRQLKRGKIVHNTCGTLADADLAFVDEFFDANDMVLRALLGVFNERVFKKGTQIEPSPLHTGIAAANYLRATEVTEAVVDRFLFRSYLDPDYNHFTLMSIDQAFARNYGRQPTSREAEKISLADLSFLADVVRGLVPHRQIKALPHVLFLKNMVLNRYRELLDSSSERASRRPVYLSPRTYAKTRFVLNAAALLRRRMEVTVADLSELKYAVTTIGAPEEQSQCFDKALNETLLRMRPADLEHVDNLMAASELAEQVLARVRDGEPVARTSFLQRLLRLLGLKSEGELTFDHVRRYVDGVQPQEEQVRSLKQGVLRRLQELTRRIDQRQTEILR